MKGAGGKGVLLGSEKQNTLTKKEAEEARGMVIAKLRSSAHAARVEIFHHGYGGLYSESQLWKKSFIILS